MTDFLTKLEELKEKAKTSTDNVMLFIFLGNHADDIAELVKAAKEVSKWSFRVLPEKALNDAEIISQIHSAKLRLSSALAALNKEKP